LKKLVLVAHPDDETLWAGGWIIQNPGCDVVCCSIPRREPMRAYEFFEAVRTLGGYPKLMPFVEPGPSEPLKIKFPDICDYDVICTHSKKGEYGHVHHMNVHDFVAERLTKNQRCLTFGYGKGASVLMLDTVTYKTKMKALACYKTHMGTQTKCEALKKRYPICTKTEETFNVFQV